MGVVRAAAAVDPTRTESYQGAPAKALQRAVAEGRLRRADVGEN